MMISKEKRQRNKSAPTDNIQKITITAAELSDT